MISAYQKTPGITQWYILILIIVIHFCRCLNNALGFSKKSLVALITNIKGREQHRRLLMSNSQKPEHLRAPSTDDLECFFSMMRDSTGQIFTTKQVDFNTCKFMENSFNAWIRTYHSIIIHLLTSVTMKDCCQVLISLHRSYQRKGFQEENSLLL